MNRAIVTGANGFIGSALLQVLSAEGIHVHAVIRNQSDISDAVRGLSGVEFVYCDLEHIDRLPTLISDRDIDVCFHLAWAGNSGGARADYALQLSNVRYTLDTVRAIACMGVKRFVGAGTLAEKDVLNYHPTDGATPNVVSNYGTAKITAHFMSKSLCTDLGVEHVWCYLSNTYGVGNTTNNFVNMASRKMLSGERAAFTAGEQMYDFVYITDTAQALYYAADRGRTNNAYYLGSGHARRLKEYIRLIRDAIDPNIELYLGEIPFNGKALPPQAYDSSKLTLDTGFSAQIQFEEGIRWTADWLRKRL